MSTATTRGYSIVDESLKFRGLRLVERAPSPPSPLKAGYLIGFREPFVVSDRDVDQGAGLNRGLQGPAIASRLSVDRPEEAWSWGLLRLGWFPYCRLKSWPT